MPKPRKATQPGGARISVYWKDGWKELVLSGKQWVQVKAGKPLNIEGSGYYYEGDFFQDYWEFGGGLERDLVVGCDDFGEGFVGKLEDAGIEEYGNPS